MEEHHHAHVLILVTCSPTILRCLLEKFCRLHKARIAQKNNLLIVRDQWSLRRPARRWPLAAPPRPDPVRVRLVTWATAVIPSVLLPLAGATLVAVGILDWTLVRRVPATSVAGLNQTSRRPMDVCKPPAWASVHSGARMEHRTKPRASYALGLMLRICLFPYGTQRQRTQIARERRTTAKYIASHHLKPSLRAAVSRPASCL